MFTVENLANPGNYLDTENILLNTLQVFLQCIYL